MKYPKQEPSFFSVGSNSKLQSHVCLLYHTRVWKVHPYRNVRIRSISKPATTQKIPEECYFTRCCISSQHNEKYSVFCGTKSLSAVDMFKFGKIIKPVENRIFNVGVEEFDIESKDWVVLGPVSFLTEITLSREGGFRFAFKASRNHHKFREATFVIKRCKTSAL